MSKMLLSIIQSSGSQMSQRTHGNVWRHFLVATARVLLLASSGRRPAMLLNVL